MESCKFNILCITSMLTSWAQNVINEEMPIIKTATGAGPWKTSNTTYMALGVFHVTSPDFRNNWLEITFYEQYFFQVSERSSTFRRDFHEFIEGEHVDASVVNINDKKEIFEKADYSRYYLYTRYANSTRVDVALKRVRRLDCMFDLKMYPFDVQQCNSYFMTIDNSSLSWTLDEPQVMFHRSSGLQDFDITDWVAEQCRHMKPMLEHKCVVFRLWIERRYMYHVLTVYLPSITITMIAFGALWLDKSLVQPRCTIGITTVLTMTTLVTQNTSNVGKLTAQDVWLLFNLHMVVFALIEYFVVYIHVQAAALVGKTLS